MKKILFVASGLLLASQVHAAPGCTAAQLNGNYVMFQAAINHHNHNGKCNINIANGVVSGSCEFGHDANGNPGFSGPVYSPGVITAVGPANAVMNINCSAIIPISFDPVPGVVHIDSVFDVQFTPDKNSLIGRFNNTFGVEGITSGTRYTPALPVFPAP